MKQWLSGARGTVLMVLTWTVGWGLGFGGIMEVVDPHGGILDVWPTAMALPGLLGGVVFCGLLRIVEGRGSFAGVSFARSALWGSVTGLVLVAVAISGTSGLVSLVISHVALRLARAVGAGEGDLFLRGLVAMGILTALGAVAAIGSCVFFRLLARRQTPAAAARPS